MDRDKVKLAELGFLIGMIVCLVLYRISDSMVFLVLGLAIMAGDVVLNVVFNKCPHCGHYLGRHHWFIEFCPYCGGYL